MSQEKLANNSNTFSVQSALQHQIAQSNKQVFGKKNKPRNQEPSMFDILKWNDPEKQSYNYKVNDLDIVAQGELAKYKYKIKKTNDNYKTEIQDNYRRYIYNKEEATYVPELTPEEEEALRQQIIQERKKHDPVLLQDQEPPGHNAIYVPNVQELDPTYRYEHGIKKVPDYESLVAELQRNHLSHGKKIYKSTDKPTSCLYYREDGDLEEDEDDDQDEQTEEQKAEAERLEQEAREAEDLLQKEKNGELLNSAQKRKIQNFKNIKSRLLALKPKAKELDPIYQKERLDRRKKRIKDFGEQTRWLPNTAFTTYFGKPAWEAYGNGNVKPTVGGVIYGNYLLSHNVNPHRGINNPKYVQTHNNALLNAETEIYPDPPRKTKDEYRLSQKQVEEHKNRSRIFPDNNKDYIPDPLKIQKPDLVNSLRFASAENTPTSAQKEADRKKKIQEELKSLKKDQRPQTAKVSQKQAATTVTKAPAVVESKQETLKKVSVTEPPKQQQQSVKVVFNELQPPQQQQQSQKPPLVASQKAKKSKKEKKSQREEIQELPERKFIEELKAKKAKSQRITLKVTEVCPSPQKKSSQADELKKSSVGPQFDLDDKNPPNGYLAQLNDYEVDPKNYKNLPPQWLKRIPFAGKKNDVGKEFNTFSQQASAGNLPSHAYDRFKQLSKQELD